MFHFSEKTSKNQKNIKKWEFFQKLCTIRLKNSGFIILGYKMLKIYILRKISFVKRTQGHEKSAYAWSSQKKIKKLPFVYFLEPDFQWSPLEQCSAVCADDNLRTGSPYSGVKGATITITYLSLIHISEPTRPY